MGHWAGWLGGPGHATHGFNVSPGWEGVQRKNELVSREGSVCQPFHHAAMPPGRCGPSTASAAAWHVQAGLGAPCAARLATRTPPAALPLQSLLHFC